LRLPLADIRFNEEFITWVLGPPALALIVLVAGIVARRRSRRASDILLTLGIGGLLLSGLWIAFLLYVDAVVGDT
jgi:hypothetical protein